ncbi:peptide-methionine (S)-S-oxide reductase MsrA [Corynebacterium pseudotuberculosis]|uniref:Peptide methionine sulfoxide reductase MsrA n=1 Tax=Corynebacterium pseudotuberculosis 258 TaxID=1168865 RepID=A0AAU8PPV2_CORPS|nr:peptide-methionine (S)-S-oxide reductase MsrA [Corynebacterium pseudotuberculosis]AER69982.1 Peptide methionine sulfoxide reductase [Corynebacterium pseudotuberculosis 1/06-A]AEQ07517.3 peptide-methionine (S)-S-oxide reductase MsrA [Corynebacterium pseudotuberculosis CIP 52.97]AFB73328.1 peptide-methionine (S)-S-oxide reductase MsrA [Corynebacterium pseudotuberculosis 316]AFH91784.1 peptide-methionine (S)-S-oxide reductase MsrA [Corynebacterium pseudotuberculosis 31]AFK17625.1 peptide-methi
MGWLFGSSPKMVADNEALKGGSQPVLSQPRPHAVLRTPITGPWKEGQEVVYVGIGCYWGAEKMFWETPGVESTSVGFAGGITPNPTYREVCTGRTNHTEIVEIVYDPAVVSFDQIIIKALEAHDPTQGYRQGNDVGTQYRSAIYTAGPYAAEQAARAREIVNAYGPKLEAAGFGPMTTEVMELAQTPSGHYYRAEDMHQQYLHKNPAGYCPHHSTGVACGIPGA